MRRFNASIMFGSALAVLSLCGCSNIVHFTAGRPSALDETVEVTAIDGRSMTRAELESLAAEYQFMARWSVNVFGAEDYEEKFQQAVEKAKAKTRELGYRVLFYTGDSETVAIVMQNANLAGTPGEVIMYALQEK